MLNLQPHPQPAKSKYEYAFLQVPRGFIDTFKSEKQELGDKGGLVQKLLSSAASFLDVFPPALLSSLRHTCRVLHAQQVGRAVCLQSVHPLIPNENLIVCSAFCFS